MIRHFSGWPIHKHNNSRAFLASLSRSLDLLSFLFSSAFGCPFSSIHDISTCASPFWDNLCMQYTKHCHLNDRWCTNHSRSEHMKLHSLILSSAHSPSWCTLTNNVVDFFWYKFHFYTVHLRHLMGNNSKELSPRQYHISILVQQHTCTAILDFWGGLGILRGVHDCALEVHRSTKDTSF